MKRLKIEELKKAFAKKNKVSTMESYEQKKSKTFQYTTDMNAMQIMEQDKDMYDADAEEGLEHLARFNEDMSMVAFNVYQIYNLFDLVCKENEEILSWMQTLEREAVNVEDRQLNIEQKVNQLLSNLK